ncbi:hypothetical protein OEA41_008509 [Lepraria neglecta]|uniref:Nineteen complex-related protein 2-domain-containing protein n=1 Tax=Lepraria neglecta TaxID=209136 RepID=A0AAE0DR09_9LECA|nr:hypothetical protein OEA41_008509 [Lepraria neglecta]
MRSSFGGRRQARKVGHDEDEEDSGDGRTGFGSQEQESTPTVIRPAITSRGSSKTKKHSSLRMSFGLGGTSMTEDDGDSAPAVFTPKKSNLSRQAVEKNALRKTLAANISSEHLPLRQTEDRPSYSADALNELKTSTPSTPKDLRSISDIEPEQNKALDLAAKFSSDLLVYDSNSAIPTDAEIREKKERRARLAKEQDFINLDDNDAEMDDEDSDGERSLLPYAKQKPKKEETRLVRDDEDIAEGFDEFVSDGRIALGKKAEREQKKRHEAEIRELINEAEGGNGSDSSEDASEAERKAAYEAAQTRKGMDGIDRGEDKTRPRRPRMPPRITPLPTLGACLERLRAQVAGKQYALMVKKKRMEEIEKEKEDILVREGEIQRLLRETAERYEKLRVESGLGEGERSNGLLVAGEGMGMAGRGLESLGDT